MDGCEMSVAADICRAKAVAPELSRLPSLRVSGPGSFCAVVIAAIGQGYPHPSAIRIYGLTDQLGSHRQDCGPAKDAKTRGCQDVVEDVETA
ncbi:hypothetical protein CMQ_1715 [Grosmannia clavigera kw1407]|uniref:Uncharacterized protein n=1 Tax=Grosmannia clavigera (strain kw1407 / UAMH 11150) TaxID=655863 RepID=F0XCX0_GROCL|nr:uncharacterized protein CMQ_1715 [Grosmannia clavigera kw1407]EFX04787.1 hypothetical protein CMQ_1715 [Grosmannia clavigera kw1407]